MKHPEKFSLSLSKAMSESDGPFTILLTSEEGTTTCYSNLVKEDLLTLSENDSVVIMELDRRIENRRWRTR